MSPSLTNIHSGQSQTRTTMETRLTASSPSLAIPLSFDQPHSANAFSNRLDLVVVERLATATSERNLTSRIVGRPDFL
jgi:hypothetical protein